MADEVVDPVARVIQANVACHLRNYQGNLTFAVHVAASGWLPAEDDPGVEQHLETLQRHLAKNGIRETDPYLLRLALTAPGTQRGILPPLAVLDTNRGGFSQRRQDEAAGQIERLRQALAIGRQFFPSLNGDTQQAIADLAAVAQRQSTPSDADWLRWLEELSAGQAERLSERAIPFLDAGDNSIKSIGAQILQQLACFRQERLADACAEALLERGVNWPASLFRDCGEAIATQLISRIEATGEQCDLNGLLACLAWTRSTAAEQSFLRWSKQPPRWASELFVPPEAYLPCAGWCLDGDGQRRDLINRECFRMVSANDPAAPTIDCRTPVDGSCPACGGALGLLFDFTRLGEKYFPGEFADAPRRLLCCLNCACYEPVFSRYRGDGIGELVSPNESRDYVDMGEVPTSVRRFDNSPCPTFLCAEPFSLNDATTFGGVPMWLQNSDYPRCLDCGRLMMFLAQLDNSTQGGEGIYYAFFCAACRISAVSYQQT